MGFSKPKAPAQTPIPPTPMLETITEDSDNEQIAKRKKRRGFDATLNPDLYQKIEVPASGSKDTMPKHSLPTPDNKPKLSLNPYPKPSVQQQNASFKKILG